ncbi:site-2 protease family protein [Desulfurivibrio alkaliphilus]|uniref:Peptidase M50 n=1 Tax=Desulfurivibrio alkaliphilus (strain DSM 19089 / UNIQEM U267 / AHT2) TaxID=589865 RepID=D6Z1L8_DESAT|nr:site-2 protease family protein [Desulfurivibrio alkaliphilus]ADH85443.1 peptidase M50 [Desulfurivibrio alkaliphilus AHT 2]
MMAELTLIQKIAVWALPLLFAITVHEVAHGWMARRLGDPTAEMLGRLSLNPIKHIDPVGTILVPGILLMLGGFIFGWAKPVPVNWRNLRDPRRDMILVSVAGPAANLGMALLWGLVLKVGLMLNPSTPLLGLPLIYMGGAGVLINLILMVLNLLPIPPLDGSRIVSGLLPPELAMQYNRLESVGFIILLALLATGMLGSIIGPPIFALRSLIFAILGI